MGRGMSPGVIWGGTGQQQEIGYDRTDNTSLYNKNNIKLYSDTKFQSKTLLSSVDNSS